MDRLYAQHTSATPPTIPAGAENGYPRSGDVGVSPTTPGAFWFHMITESLRNVIVGAELSPSAGDFWLLLHAIQTIAASQKVLQASDAEVAAGADVQKYVAPDQLAAAIDAKKSVQEMRGGTYAVGAAESAADIYVEFSTPFPSVCHVVVPAPFDPSAAATSHDNYPIVKSWDRFGFVFSNNAPDPEGNYLAGISYIAYGG